MGSKRSSKCVSTLQLLFLMLKKFLHKLWRIQKISCTIKLWEKKSCTRKLPSPRQKNNVANMQRFSLRLRCELTSQVNEFSIKAPLTDFLKSTKFIYFAWNALLKAFEIFQYPLCGYSRYLFQPVFTKHWKYFLCKFSNFLLRGANRRLLCYLL